jgi:hypothetical protein
MDDYLFLDFHGGEFLLIPREVLGDAQDLESLMKRFFYVFNRLETFRARGDDDLWVNGFDFLVELHQTMISPVEFPLEHIRYTAAGGHPTKNGIGTPEIIE